MRIWKNTRLDGILLILSVLQFIITLTIALSWNQASIFLQVGAFVLMVMMISYNIIVISHVFTHQPWFEPAFLNHCVSMLNSLNIGQSVEIYKLTHVKNHHKYNNDRKGPNGSTQDLSSTYRDGENQDHSGLFRYAFLGAFGTLFGVLKTLSYAIRIWRVGKNESLIFSLLSKSTTKRALELRQIQLDRLFISIGILFFTIINWQWVLFCFIPVLYLSFALVNIQNYYEHFGAEPSNRYANSVSYYGRLYNVITFNDGYHQEHHLRPQMHWSRLPEVHTQFKKDFDNVNRVVSPVPAMLGFFHRGRTQQSEKKKSDGI